MTAKTKNISLQEELMLALNVTESDLEANREGKLSVDQMRKLKSSKSIRGIRFMLIGFVAGILWSCWFVVALLQPDRPVYVYMLFIFFIGLSGISLIMGYFEYSEINSEIAEGKVETIRGRIHTGAVAWLNQTMVIDGLRLKANREALQYILDDELYAVCFLPRSKIVVSVEVVGD